MASGPNFSLKIQSMGLRLSAIPRLQSAATARDSLHHGLWRRRRRRRRDWLSRGSPSESDRIKSAGAGPPSSSIKPERAFNGEPCFRRCRRRRRRHRRHPNRRKKNRRSLFGRGNFLLLSFFCVCVCVCLAFVIVGCDRATPNEKSGREENGVPRLSLRRDAVPPPPPSRRPCADRPPPAIYNVEAATLNRKQSGCEGRRRYRQHQLINNTGRRRRRRRRRRGRRRGHRTTGGRTERRS